MNDSREIMDISQNRELTKKYSAVTQEKLQSVKNIVDKRYPNAHNLPRKSYDVLCAYIFLTESGLWGHLKWLN